MIRVVFLFVLINVLVSCKKDTVIVAPQPDTPAVAEQKITIQMLPQYQQQDLVFNKLLYKTSANDSVNITNWRYYISNVNFKSATSSFRLRDDYFLVDLQYPGRRSFSVKGVPPGQYTSLEFIIGIDSTRNVSGAQTGVLAQDSGMFWSWSQGYIFSKLEGEFKNAATTSPQLFSHHIGGFSGLYNCIVKASISFTASPLVVSETSRNEIILNADLADYLNGPVVIDMATYAAVSGGKNAKTIADNYKSMFRVKEIKN